MKKKKKIKNCAPFTEYRYKTNNTYGKDLNLLIPMYHIIKYRDNYLKISGSIWQYYQNESALDDDGNIVNF